MSEDRNKARAAILQRRARLMAMTLATVSTGSACGGKAEGEGQNRNGDTIHMPGVCLTMVCLSYDPCLQPPDYPCLGAGGTGVCLSVPYTGGTGGGIQVCLEMPYSGGMGGLGGEGLGGAGAGGTGSGGLSEPEDETGGAPQVCLTPPR
jgi:hypothetical protein